jgi:hypothetical protein
VVIKKEILPPIDLPFAMVLNLYIGYFLPTNAAMGSEKTNINTAVK